MKTTGFQYDKIVLSRQPNESKLLLNDVERRSEMTELAEMTISCACAYEKLFLKCHDNKVAIFPPLIIFPFLFSVYMQIYDKT